MRSWISIILVVSLALLTMSCAMNKAQKGAVIGAGTGTVVGGVIGKKAGSTAGGAVAGAAVGGIAGGYIGKYMDKQAEDIEESVEGVEVERVGEGIVMTFDSGLLFDVNQSTLKPETQANLNNFAKVLKEYPDTDILIEGHTDSSGSDDYNLELSKRRAQSVSNYLAGLGVDPRRFTIMGYGESRPVATNDTPEGRQANRRVEIAIMANDDLKAKAQESAK